MITVGQKRMFMQMAIDQSSLCPSGVVPVGVVVVRGGVVLATGYKGEQGADDPTHAEALALRKLEAAGANARNASIYVTLEPCAGGVRSKRSCAELLVAAGIKDIWIGYFDRNPQVNRQGWRILNEAKIKSMILKVTYATRLLQPDRFLPSISRMRSG